MTDLRQAMLQALEALDSDNPDIQLRAAVTLRVALAAQQPEPVAWRLESRWEVEPLYTHPPQRQHDEIEQLKAERDVLLDALNAMTDAFLDTEGSHGSVERDAMDKAYAAIDAARSEA